MSAPLIVIVVVRREDPHPALPRGTGRGGILARALAGGGFASHLVQDDAGDVGGVGVAGEEDVGGGDFFGLGGAFHGGFAAELGDFLGGHAGVAGVEGGPDGAGGDGVYADAFLDELLGEGLGEGVDGALGGAVIRE